MRKAEIIRTHSCPICGKCYESRTLNGTDQYIANFARYNNSPAMYNESVKDNYAQKLKIESSSNTISTPSSTTLESSNSP